MSDVPFSRERFLAALNGIAGGQTTPEELTRQLRRALLDFGSETPDNLNCASRVEVGRVGPETGPKITGQDALFSDISHALESAAMPAEIRKQFPEISEKDWDAFTRMTTLLYILLSPGGSPDR